MSIKVSVIYYSSTGGVHRLAEAVAQGATAAGADVRLRRTAELAPDSAIDANPRWREHVDMVAHEIPEATLDDLEWADAYAFGTPTRFGAVSAQLKQFLDSTGGLWQRGVFIDQPVTAFTAAHNAHGGHETTLASLNNVFIHWGAIFVAPGYTDALLYAAGGNPYGTSFVSGQSDLPPEATLEAARYQGRRLVDVTRRLVSPRPALAMSEG
jgi:NAD(P)H dehydrogenase (quinone)